MKKEALLTLLEDFPIVAAVKDEDGLNACLTSECRIVFVLYGSILDIGEIVHKIKESGRIALVHVDLIKGLMPKEIAVDFIAEKTEADGIISTRQSIIRYGRMKGFITVQRFFLLDSLALSTIGKQIEQSAPDLVELLPGCLPKIIRKVHDTCPTPLIAGGLIQDKEDILAALSAGASGISATRSEIWAM
ncbi:MAG: glycerol-3-phosphate responsive antiterminator [Eubacteriales bacterium]|nr:glycerol-3-phosphate responsive antiterminator [Eubacteriales bacterium]